jgi:hypothetical protein
MCMQPLRLESSDSSPGSCCSYYPAPPLRLQVLEPGTDFAAAIIPAPPLLLQSCAACAHFPLLRVQMSNPSPGSCCSCYSNSGNAALRRLTHSPLVLQQPSNQVLLLACHLHMESAYMCLRQVILSSQPFSSPVSFSASKMKSFHSTISIHVHVHDINMNPKR